MNLGPLEIGIVLLIVLVIFGPKRLPQLGRSLGSGMREFKDAVTGRHKDDEPDQIEAGSTDRVAQSEASETVARTSANESAARPDGDDAQRAKTADAS